METWFAILETIKNQGSSIKYQVLRIYMLKDLFEDLDSQFWENDLNIAHKTITIEGQRAQHTACLKTQTNTHENMFISYKTPVLAKPWLSVVNIIYIYKT